MTIGTVVILIVAVLVAGVATALSLRGFLVDRVDDQLRAVAAERYADSVEAGDLPLFGRTENLDNEQDLDQLKSTVKIILADGAVTAAAVAGAEDVDIAGTFSADDVQSLRSLPVGGDPRTVDLSGLDDYRLIAVAGPDGSIEISGLPLEDVEGTLGRLAKIQIVILLIVVVAGAAATAVIVRRMLLPLQRVATAALHVSEQPLTAADVGLPERIAPAEPTTEVDQLSAAFDHMIDHIRTALTVRAATEERLRRFIADASHELRTPLAAIRAHSEYALLTAEPIPESTAASLERIDAAAIRMGALVDDLLLLAQLDAGRPLATEVVDLTRLVIDAVTDAQATAAEHLWRLDLPDQPVEVVGDSQRLHQVVTNLLGNACKHTPSGTTVRVALRGSRTGTDLSVCDDGPGIPAADQSKLFDRFTRGDAGRSSEQGSTGLGLAIARGIAHAHGGTLTVESTGGRTCFTLHLPPSDYLDAAALPMVDAVPAS